MNKLIVIPYIIGIIGTWRSLGKSEERSGFSRFISWVIMILFSIAHTSFLPAIFEILDGFDVNHDFLTNENIFVFVIGCIVIESILLFLLNKSTLKDKSKAFIVTFRQVCISMVLIPAVVLMIIGFFSGNSSSKETVRKTFTPREDEYARNQGYYDAENANRAGLDTSKANDSSFDISKKN